MITLNEYFARNNNEHVWLLNIELLGITYNYLCYSSVFVLRKAVTERVMWRENIQLTSPSPGAPWPLSITTNSLRVSAWMIIVMAWKSSEVGSRLAPGLRRDLAEVLVIQTGCLLPEPCIQIVRDKTSLNFLPNQKRENCLRPKSCLHLHLNSVRMLRCFK